LKIEPISQVFITQNYENVIESLKNAAPSSSLFELFIKDGENFKVEDANEVIAKAYLASEYKVFLVLYADNFSEVVQNRLLKIIEEPPKNKEFILITPSKSALLPTIKSRLPVVSIKDNLEQIELNLNFSNLTLNDVYNFIQEHKNLKPKEAIEYLEAIVTNAIKSKNFNLDASCFDSFKNARVALNLGSPADFVLTSTLLKLLAKKQKKANL